MKQLQYSSTYMHLSLFSESLNLIHFSSEEILGERLYIQHASVYISISE